MTGEPPADVESSGDPEHSPERFGDPSSLRSVARRPRQSLARSWASFIPILGMGVCSYLLAQSKDDLTYLFAPSTPVDLGQPGAYHLERAQPGLFARISGEIRGEGNRFQEGHRFGKIWPIAGAPVLIERRDLEPLWGHVEVAGRLQSDDQLVAPFHKLIAMFLGTGQLGSPGPNGHVWLITQGRAPRAFDRTNGWLAVLVLLFGINGWLVIRPVLRR